MKMSLPKLRRFRATALYTLVGMTTMGYVATETSANTVLANFAAQVANDARLTTDANRFAKAVLTDASSDRRTADWTGELVYRGTDWSELFERARLATTASVLIFAE